jgi:hypothetical protein
MRNGRRRYSRTLRLSSLSCFLLLVGWDARSCRSAAPVKASVPCDSVSAVVGDVDVSLLAGEFTLVLVENDGARVEGVIRLSPYGGGHAPAAARVHRDDPGAAAEYPLHGSASIDLSRVGATAPGSIESSDPESPGVLGVRAPLAASETGRLFLRFGSDVNSGGSPLFDGTHMALTVHTASVDRFAGTWSSGAPDVASRGFFCATRRSD